MVLLRELALASFLALAGGANAFYSKSSGVLMLDQKSFKKEILDSNHAAVVEFFAPWCGHCQNLKPAYEKAAKALKGLAKVGAVDCDDDANKAFCHQSGVQGFPAIKVFRPGAKKGKPNVEDYRGARTAKAIVDAVVERIPNHVTRIKSSDLDNFLSEKNETAKAILFTNKGMTTTLWKALAIDFLGSITLGQIRDKETEAVERFGITNFPTIVVLPGGDAEGQVYDGKMEKSEIFDFFANISPPLPEPSETKKSKNTASSNAKTSEETESSSPKAEKPKAVIPELSDEAALKEACLLAKSKPCLLAIANIPDASAENRARDEGILADLNEVYDRHTSSPFKFFKISAFLPHADELAHKLDLAPELPALVVVNAQRGWFKRYTGEPTVEGISAWVDSVRLGDGKKEKLPEGLVEIEKEEKVEDKIEEKEVKEEEVVEEKGEEKEAEEEEAEEEEAEEEEANEEEANEEFKKAKDERHDEL